jgi:hypothetical protein
VPRLARLLLPVWFLAMSAFEIGRHGIDLAYVGADAHMYYSAAEVFVSGGDPWNLAGSWGVYQFAGLPPTVLMFVPFLVLPYWLNTVLWVAADAIAAVFIVRRLGLAWWWLLFPPVVAGVWIGNPHLVLIALLLTRLAPISPLVKVYTVIPMLGERRWRQVLVAGALIGGTVIVAPGLWADWLANAGTISARLVFQATSQSAWGFWPLELLGVVLLLSLGLRRAGWLAVPVLWPGTEFLYGSMALPVVTPVLGFIMAIPLPGMPLVAATAEAGVVWLRSRRSAERDDVASGAAIKASPP